MVPPVPAGHPDRAGGSPSRQGPDRGPQVVPWLAHSANIVAGTVLALHFFGAGVFHLLGLTTLGYVLLARGTAAGALILVFNFVVES